MESNSKQGGSMITYDDKDMKQAEDWADILLHLGGDTPSDEDIWDKAKKYEFCPCFENLYLEELASRIKKYGLVDEYNIDLNNSTLYCNIITTNKDNKGSEILSWIKKEIKDLDDYIEAQNYLEDEL